MQQKKENNIYAYRSTRILIVFYRVLCFFLFRYKVLHISSGVEEMGDVHLGLLLCLCIAWVLTFVCVCKGIKVTGKVRLRRSVNLIL